MTRFTRRGAISTVAGLATAGLVVPATAQAAPANNGLSTSHTSERFHVGQEPYEAYVEHVRPAVRRHHTPLVLIHGARHSGLCWQSTPDNRKSWATYLAENGWDVFVMDWPGHGRSGFPPRFSTMSILRVVDAVSALLDHLGTATIIGHSVGGEVSWLSGERARSKLAGIVGIAPGAPANLVRPAPPDQVTPESSPAFPDRADTSKFFANSTRFPRKSFESYFRSLCPESPRILNERRNADGKGISISGPEALGGLPKLVVTGDQDPRHPRAVDEQLADWLGADFVWLPDEGLPGHGHMQMLEHGSLEIAALVQRWLVGHVG